MNVLQSVVGYLRKNDFIRGVTVLVSGTALSQGLVILLTPLLTRIYSPEEFGVLSIYLSVVLTVSIVSSWYYDTVIPLPKKETDAINLLGLSLVLLVFNTILAFILLNFLKTYLLNIFDTNGLGDILFFLPFSIFGFGLFGIFEMWMVRQEGYNHITTGKVRMNMTQILTQAGLGLLWPSPWSLMTGEVMGRLAGGGGMAFVSWKRIKHQFSCISITSLKQVARRYIRFPLIGSWSSLLKSISQHLPTLFIAFALGTKEAGLYLLADRILALPDGLLGYAVKRVYMAKASRILHVSFDAFKILFWSMVKKMGMISFVVYTLIFLAAPGIFPVVFGGNWGEASIFLQCLSLLYFCKLIIGPVREIFTLLEEQFIEVLGEIISFLCLLAGIIFAYLYVDQAWQVVLCISVFGTIGDVGVAVFSWLVLIRGEKRFKQSRGIAYEKHHLSS